MKRIMFARQKSNYVSKWFVLIAASVVLALTVGWGVLAERAVTETTATPCLGPGLTPGFTNAPDFPVGSVPNAIAVGDFNGDGIQDLAIANRAPDNDVSIRLGNGSGGFTTMPRVAVGVDPVSIAVGDFNGDGKADYVTANQNSNSVSLRLGNGVGGFTSPTVPEIAVGERPTFLVVGDFDKDGNKDYAVYTDGSAAGSILKPEFFAIRLTIDFGNGNGAFIRREAIFQGDTFFDVNRTLLAFFEVGDINADGDLDFIVPTPPPDGTAANHVEAGSSVAIRLRDGAGGYRSAPSLPFAFTVESVALADFNGDGKPDLLATGDEAGGHVSIRLGDGAGGFTPAVVPEVTVGAGAYLVRVADFNSDGKMDFATGNASTVSIRLGNGLGGFTSPQVAEVPVGSIIGALTIGDFNNDGRPDLAAVINEINGLSHVAVRLGNCTSTSVTPTPTPTPAPTPSVESGFNPNPNEAVNVVVVQPDGKILIGGAFTSVAPNGGAAVARSHIARFNPDGTLDTAFNPPTLNNDVTTLALQSDGKVLVGGNFSNVGGQSRQGFVRLDATTGAADSLNPGVIGSVSVVVVQPDERILIGGFFSGNPVGGQVRNYIARFDPVTGLADSFNPNANNSVETIAVLPDGRILAGGTFTTIGGQPRNRIARLNATTGAADSFDPNANGSGGLFQSVVLRIAVQPDGKILVGGNFTSIGGQPRIRIGRLDGVTGLADAFEPNMSNTVVTSIALESDGRILAGGREINAGGRLARFNTDGTLTEFNVYPTDWVNTIALQTDGRFIVGGRFTFIAGQPRNRIARLSLSTTTGTPTPTPTATTTPTPTPTPSPTPAASPTPTPTPTPSPSPTPVLFDFNSNRNASFFVWDVSLTAVGWYITPTVSMNLTKIETNFNPIIQAGSQNRTVTVEILTDRRAAGGTLIRSATFNSAIARGTLGGGSFAPVALTAGTKYFIGFRNISGIGTNTTQDAGATNCGACIYLDNASSAEGQYQTRGGSDQPSVIDQPILRLIGTPLAATVTGRVLTPDGRGLMSSAVSIIDSVGIRRTVLTNSFGIYTISNVRANEGYTMLVSSKRYRFSQRTLQVNGDLSNVDFAGVE